MKIPDKIKIGAHYYIVKYPYEFTERGDLKGQQDADSCEIKISAKDGWSHTDRPETQIAVTFLYEILHAVDYVTGHKVFRENENAIEGISEMLFQVIRDNKLRFDEE